ncbi:hypothetical protein [Microvirga sp. KLBC 81]|uniref:hypothetical protein n=1 Tax=Microvirga sp. KLBC 81 TaxID=1862707 RepID=UPI00140276A9|nr:hypothetical protein [Microvirga sp. KLBC 81]
MKARLVGNEDPDEWDLPPKPKDMHWATYERWVARYDAAEDLPMPALPWQQHG